MLGTLSLLIAGAVDGLMRVCRLPILNSSHVYALLGVRAAQPLLASLARHRAVAVASRAARTCPAYVRFIDANGARGLIKARSFDRIPETTKDNYVRAYTIEERCRNGRIPSRGVVIDESSGSSGTPNNWVRGRSERAGVRRMLQHGMNLTYAGHEALLLNCFALGPWATGMNVSMSLADMVILKSIGPDKAKLESTLRTFGPRYRYVIAGYPPFMKDVLSTTSLDLASYNLHLIVGGEGMSEALRDRFLRAFKTVHSSYGASDLEINLGVETELSIAVRRACVRDPELSASLFGSAEPPMLFQHDPMAYMVESNAQRELVFTLLRPGIVAPKVRYNLRDLGGVIPHRVLMRTLSDHGIRTADLPRGAAFPFLYVFGRSDLSVPFYGAKILTSDMDAVINSEDLAGERIHSFQLRVTHDSDLNEILRIAIEHAHGVTPPDDATMLRDPILRGLQRVNQDFREVSRMFTPDRVVIECHRFGEGPFAQRDIRIKQRYIAPPVQP
ncbi:MAG: hypothetical protein IT434_15440 [Phycisphaerales bacterium]|nr:hypothetical protein [Phycisphaerales bacterium]